MKKIDLLNHLKNEVYCRLMQSNIHGVGIFAIKNIPKDTDIFKSSHREYVKISRKEIEKQNTDAEVLKMLEDFFVEENNYFYIPKNGFADLDISFYLNHSENPNVRFDEETDGIIALRDIKKGEQLFSDYETYDKDWMKKNKKKLI